METKELKVLLPKESCELAAGFVKFAEVVIGAMKDGFQMGTDIPPIVQSALLDLLPALSGIEKVSAEFAADPAGVVQAFASAGFDLAKVVIAPKKAA